MSFIEELFYGNLDPQSRSPHAVRQISRSAASLDELEDILTERLQGEDKRLFARLVSRLANLTARFVKELFFVSTFLDWYKMMSTSRKVL